ncbi:MAG: purine-nucleoside phosphorylase [Methanobacteriota archaeon]|nr:MAG: purine-nucleoside phosphorylase [Euryarchaeota archaeon]
MRGDDSIVRPDHFVRYLRRVVGLRPAETRLPTRAVLVFGGQDFRTLARMVGAKVLPWNRSMAVGRAGNRRVVVARTTIGAPATAIMIEEMAALGAREFLAFGACGSLVPRLKIGAIVVPTFAATDEGTSRHYGGAGRARPDTALRAALVRACEGRGVPFTEGGTWTMDAVYRETFARARALAARGVVAVDMEASAIWAVARHRGLRAASLFVVSDELGGDGWNPGFRDPAFLDGKRRALRVLVEALAGNSP